MYSVFEYLYNVSADNNDIHNQEFAVSAHLENEWIIKEEAINDGWTDIYRLEMGINIWDDTNSTSISPRFPWIWIDRDVTSFSCLHPIGGRAMSDCDTQQYPMLIRSH